MLKLGMFRWDSDTCTFKIDEARFHIDALPDGDLVDYTFDVDSYFQGLNRKYSVSSIRIWAHAFKYVNNKKWQSNKYLNSRQNNYNEKSKGSMYKVKKALDSGILIKPDKCSICNKGNCRIFGHHEDYDKPLDVIWVCFGCHIKIHKIKITVNNGWTQPIAGKLSQR